MVRVAGFVLSRLQLRYLAGDMQHDGLARGKVIIVQSAIDITQLDAHTTTELHLAAVLATVLLVLHEELQVGNGQHIANLNIAGIVYTVLLGQPSTLLACLFPIDVGGIYANPSVLTTIRVTCEIELCVLLASAWFLPLHIVVFHAGAPVFSWELLSPFFQ